MVETEVALQSSLEALESEWKALESERKARSEVDQEVLALRGQVLGTFASNSLCCQDFVLGHFPLFLLS